MANRHALLIGVPVYDDDEFNEPRLADAVRSDVAAMRAALDQSDYAITDCPAREAERGGATLNRIKAALDEACANASAGGVLLIYFSGHGITVDGRDYLIPSDSYRPRGNRGGALARGSLVPVIPDSDALADCRAALVVIFVDACRNQAAQAGQGSGEPPANAAERGPAQVAGVRYAVEPGGQQPFLAGGGQLVLMMGCGAGEVCQYDDTGSAFTRALAKVLDPRNSARTLSEVTKAVTADMERRSRQTQGAHQVPVVRNPGMLTLAGDHVVCDGDELADAWRKAVDASPLLPLCPAPDLVRDVVAECARRRRAATAALLDRTGLADSWTDQDYPGRVLRNTELILREAGLIARESEPPGAAVAERPATGPRLRAGEAAVLIAAPFLREAVLAVGIRDAAAIDPANLDRTYTPGARSDLELTHEMYQHLVRRAIGLREYAIAGTAAGGAQANSALAAGPTASDRLAMWLVHQWLAGRVPLWDEPGAREVYALARPLIKGYLGTAGETEAPRLIQALVRVVGAGPADAGLLDKLTGPHVDDGWRAAAAVLWLAGIMAADPRRLPPVVPDLVGTGMELPLTDVRDAAGQRDAWVWAEDRVIDLQLVCEHPALHDAFLDIVARASAAVATIGSGLDLPPSRVGRLPIGFTANGLRPARKQDDRPAYDVPLSRFQIAEEKVRELLMGRQLYGEPELAIRELYQNALDACRWRATRQEYLTRTGQDPADWAGRIQFRQGTDDDGRPYIECEDNGVGMDLNTLKHVFANAGERFVYGQEFRTEQAEWADLDPPLRMVSNSQFGVGVFSYFMLADEITVVTRYQHRDGVPDPRAHEVRIASSGSLFQIRPAPGRLPAGGTRVRLYLSGDARKVSALGALRDFLWVAEHRVEVTAPDGGEIWEPGELRYQWGTVAPRKSGRDLWWVPGMGGLIADGIGTSVQFHGFVVNLRDQHRPQFTVDRKMLRAWDQRWVADERDIALPDLMTWPGFTLSWLWAIARSDTAFAQQIFEHAWAADLRVRATDWDAAPLVPLNEVGCVPSDQNLIDDPGVQSANPRFLAWRQGVWRHLTGSFYGQTEPLPLARHSAGLRPERIAGFPVPDPVDGRLLGDRLVSTFGGYDELLPAVQISSAIAQVGCSLRAGVRRLRRYALTGLDLSAAREIPAIDAAFSADAYHLLNALAPWPPAAGTPPRKLIEALVKAGLSFGPSVQDVVGSARSMTGWPDSAPGLTEAMDDAVTQAQRILDFLYALMEDSRALQDLRRGALLLLASAEEEGDSPPGGGFSRLFSSATGPSQLAQASEQLGLTVSRVLELSDVLAPMGVTVSARDAYPPEIRPIEMLALKRTQDPGARLSWPGLMLIALESGISAAEAHEALGRLEACGLIIRPDLYGDHGPTEREVARLDHRAPGELVRLVGPGPVSDLLWKRIVQIIKRPRDLDHDLVPAARDLVPLTTPDRQATLVELTDVAWELQMTLAGATAALRDVYPEIKLPAVPADCVDLVVPWAARDALVMDSQDGFCWELGPLPIVACALRAATPLGDFLAILDPFRKLGAPVPRYDEAIREVLNKVALDQYDQEMLMGTPGSGSVTALWLVQTAGRFGWTLAEAHQRFARLVPVGVRLDYPRSELPDEIVRWEDLLVLTTFFDGQPPVITGTVTQPYLEKAAEEIFDAGPQEIPAKAAWLRQRLRIYAALFSLELDRPGEVVVD